MANDGDNRTGLSTLSTSTGTGQCGEFRAPDASAAVSTGSIATTAFSLDAKVVTVRAIRGSTVSVPFDVKRESVRSDNLRANGFTVIIDTTTEAPGGPK